jgi:hypothetical protein
MYVLVKWEENVKEEPCPKLYYENCISDIYEIYSALLRRFIFYEVSRLLLFVGTLDF